MENIFHVTFTPVTAHTLSFIFNFPNFFSLHRSCSLPQLFIFLTSYEVELCSVEQRCDQSLAEASPFKQWIVCKTEVWTKGFFSIFIHFYFSFFTLHRAVVVCRVHFWCFVRSQKTVGFHHRHHRHQVIKAVSHIIMSEHRSVTAKARCRINANTLLTYTCYDNWLVIERRPRHLPQSSFPAYYQLVLLCFPLDRRQGEWMRMGREHRGGSRSPAGRFICWLTGPLVAGHATLQTLHSTSTKKISSCRQCL